MLIPNNKSSYCECEEVNVKKIGNLLIYLSSKIPNLYLTRLLKLLYIIDEQSVKSSGYPITDLSYHVWKRGPVSRPIYNSITFEDTLGINKYIRIIESENSKKIEPLMKFDDSEFSDYEMELIDLIIDSTTGTSTDDLIDILHDENSLWKKIVDDKKLQKVFDNGESNTSPYIIDLSEYIKNEPLKLNVYNHYIESKMFDKSF